ncbi:hypothetical protein J4I42_004060 [Salmonella enterica]|nr:hypothetical protein [Salmonella enterica]
MSKWNIASFSKEEQDKVSVDKPSLLMLPAGIKPDNCQPSRDCYPPCWRGFPLSRM